MYGEGFVRLVQQNQRVSLGQKLMRFDLDKIRAAGHGTTVLVVVTNSTLYDEITFDAKAEVRRLEVVGQFFNTRKG
jgi:phosphotransferase system IIA component